MTGRGPVVIRGDARALPLPDESVNLVCTSPPYWGLRSYQDAGEHYAGQIGTEATADDYLDALVDCVREWCRVLAPDGSLWVNLGDTYAGTRSLCGLPWRFALRCRDDLGLMLRAEVIWSKTNGLPESVTDRVRRNHETWFHFTLSDRGYFAAVDDIREPYSGDRAFSRRIKHPGTGKHEQRAAWTAENPAGSLPGSVWPVPTQPSQVPPELGADHYAAFPVELPRRIVRGWCPPGGVVLDTFGGTGTTAVVAAVHGRTGISVDRSADYCRIARWRGNDPRERARAAGTDPDRVARIPRPAVDQLAMWGD